jgi:uncharacterized protein (DUF302 family)
MLRIALVVMLTTVLLAFPADAELVRKESPYPVAQTVDRLEAEIKQRKLNVFAKIDHAAGAKQVGQDLRPTVLIIFGNPAVGTPLIQAEQTMGLSLPRKILAWQDAAGKVWLGYDAPSAMAAERAVDKSHPVIVKIAGALNGIADAVVKR